MSVNTPRWIRAALAALLLACSAGLLAQDKDKEKEPPRKSPPAHEKGGNRPANPPANAPAPRSEQRTERIPPAAPSTANPPATRPNFPRNDAAPQNDRGMRPAIANPPAQSQPPVRPQGNQNNPAPAANPQPGRQFGNGGNQNQIQNQNQNQNRGRLPSDPGIRNGTPAGVAPQNGGRQVYRGANNTEVHYRTNGEPQIVRTRDMTITHTPSGVRRVEVERPDHTVIVARGESHGYIQRPYVVRNVTYVQRTYYVGGVSYARVYRPYVYNGISLNLYVSSRYYPPAYYGWAYSPWSTPVVYRWGWNSSPWYGYYGGYFTPYPTYASAAFWLTDYIIATTLEHAYQERMDAAAQANSGYGSYAGGQSSLTPEVKQAISDEVRRQLDQERAEGQAMSPNSGGAPAFLSDNSSHVFVVANGLDVMSRWGECSLTEGDVLQMTAGPGTAAASADLSVLASKGQDCRRGSVVSVSIPDLQDMQNHMRETLDQGLGDLQSRQGQGGLPELPPAAQRAPVDAPYATAAPPPDPNVATELSQQYQSATQAEGEVLSQAQSAPQSNNSGPVTLTLGLTIDQVVSVMGQPQVVADLGAKKTYFYSNMKVIFLDGKVTEIQ